MVAFCFTYYTTKETMFDDNFVLFTSNLFDAASEKEQQLVVIFLTLSHLIWLLCPISCCNQHEMLSILLQYLSPFFPIHTSFPILIVQHFLQTFSNPTNQIFHFSPNHHTFSQTHLHRIASPRRCTNKENYFTISGVCSYSFDILIMMG